MKGSSMIKHAAKLILFSGLMCVSGAYAKYKLQQGDQAPSFKLQDEMGTWRTLEEFRGKKVVLYFYSKDDTAKSVKQACGFRNQAHIYEAKGMAVVGVNYDTPESHAEFKAKYQLPFTLLSDTTTQVAKVYGAYGKVPLFNKYFPNRRTFLINEYGTIVRIIEDVDVVTHAEDVLKEFDSAQR